VGEAGLDEEYIAQPRAELQMKIASSNLRRLVRQVLLESNSQEARGSFAPDVSMDDLVTVALHLTGVGSSHSYDALRHTVAAGRMAKSVGLDREDLLKGIEGAQSIMPNSTALLDLLHLALTVYDRLKISVPRNVLTIKADALDALGYDTAKIGKMPSTENIGAIKICFSAKETLERVFEVVGKEILPAIRKAMRFEDSKDHFTTMVEEAVNRAVRLLQDITADQVTEIMQLIEAHQFFLTPAEVSDDHREKLREIIMSGNVTQAASLLQALGHDAGQRSHDEMERSWHERALKHGAISFPEPVKGLSDNQLYKLRRKARGGALLRGQNRS